MTKPKSRYTIEIPVIRMDLETTLIRVDDNSPKKHRKAVEQIAKNFQREMEFCTLLYESEDYDGAITYLIQKGPD